MKFYTTLFLLLAVAFSLKSQITNGPVKFDKKLTIEALRMSLDADYEAVADSWEDFWDERYEVDFDKLDKEKASIALSAEQAAVPLISEKNADLFAKIGGTATTTSVSFAISFTENDVVTALTYPASYRAAESIMLEFRTYYYTRYFEEELSELREELADLRDDSIDASDDAEKARRKIEKYEEKIEKYRRKIEKERESVGDELETAEEKARKASELERQIRELERQRARYLG